MQDQNSSDSAHYIELPATNHKHYVSMSLWYEFMEIVDKIHRMALSDEVQSVYNSDSVIGSS